MRTQVPSASTSTSAAAESASGATPSRNRSRARRRSMAAMASPADLTEFITVVADTAEPPASAISPAVRAEARRTRRRELSVARLQRAGHRLGAAGQRDRPRARLEGAEAGGAIPQHAQERGFQRRHGGRYGKIHLGSPFLESRQSEGKGDPHSFQTNRNFMPSSDARDCARVRPGALGTRRQRHAHRRTWSRADRPSQREYSRA